MCRVNQHPIEHIYIAYGSESGNAEALANQLYQQAFLQGYALSISPLNDLKLEQLTSNGLLLVLASTFGDGEPAGNADEFLEQLNNFEALPFAYSIFALGDITYPQFCGFGKAVDLRLADKQARQLIQTVEADLNYQQIFNQWLKLLQQALTDLPTESIQHSLSVKVYHEQNAFYAQVLQIEKLAQSEPAVYHLRLDLKNSGIIYQAGDLLYVNIENPDSLLQQYAQYWQDEAVYTQLRNKELRLLSKNLLREIAKLCNHSELKALLKISNKKALEAYIYGRDLLDVLIDFDPQRMLSLAQLEPILPQLLARAYSISSCGRTHPEYVDLCVREVNYQLNNRTYQGTASHYLAQLATGDQVELFVRSNPTFHLPENPDVPIIMVGAGTGIAPFIGFLQTRQQQPIRAKSYLFFGERFHQRDFLYQLVLQGYLADQTLTALFCAFSRDQTEKFYVQDAIVQQAELLWSLLKQGAHLYICGSKAMGKAVEESVLRIAEQIGNQPYLDDFNNIIADLVNQNRLHRDLY